jgi:hypothetical protein
VLPAVAAVKGQQKCSIEEGAEVAETRKVLKS